MDDQRDHDLDPGAAPDPDATAAPAPVSDDEETAPIAPWPPGPPPPPPTRPLSGPPAGPPAGSPFGPPTPRPGRPSRWVWPVVAVLALVLGVVGGLAGAAGYDAWIEDDEGSGPGQVEGGLGEVDVVTDPPLEEGGSVAAVARTLLPSTVQILAEFEGQASGATGSGFVLDREGHIVTNNHVVEDAAANDGPIEIVDHEGNRYDATVVGRSPVYDLAVLFVEDADDLQPAALGRSQALRVGEPVVAIGSPLGLSSTVTSGIVSALNRPVTTGSTADDSSYINAVQTDAAINPGNSGGPLVNLRGQVVGVNSAIATNGGGTIDGEAGNIGVGFAIPVEQVGVTADQILRTGEARYPVIGAQVQTGGSPTYDGATLEEIVPDSPAEAAGLEQGDVITRVEGERVTDGIALIVAIRAHQPGQTIEFTVERDGDERTVEVTLDGEVG